MSNVSRVYARTKVPMQRRSSIIESGATCDTCGWESEARNAAGSGAQHAYQTGHTVRTWQTGQTYYEPVR